MIAASVTIDRSSLSEADLTIADSGTYCLTEKGLGRPGITWRKATAPDSADVHGSEYFAAVKEQTSLPLEVAILADSSAELEAAIDELTDALSQFTYTVTVTVGGVSKVWDAGPADWSAASGLVEFSKANRFFDVLKVTIPIYPIPGSVLSESSSSSSSSSS